MLNTEVRVSRCGDNAPPRGRTTQPQAEREIFHLLLRKRRCDRSLRAVNLGIWLRNTLRIRTYEAQEDAGLPAPQYNVAGVGVHPKSETGD